MAKVRLNTEKSDLLEMAGTAGGAYFGGIGMVSLFSLAGHLILKTIAATALAPYGTLIVLGALVAGVILAKRFAHSFSGGQEFKHGILFSVATFAAYCFSASTGFNFGWGLALIAGIFAVASGAHVGANMGRAAVRKLTGKSLRRGVVYG